MSITLSELRLAARRRADMENNNFVQDAELNTYINSSIAELYDLLLEAYGAEYYVADPVEIDIVSGTSAYDLPDGTLYSGAPEFYELKGVDIKLSGSNYVNVPKFNWNERNRDAGFTVFDLLGTTNIRYRIMGNQIRLTPEPDTSATLRLWYVPLPTALVNDDDSLNDFNSYSEYVIVDAAIKMLIKQEDLEVAQAFTSQKEALAKRIRDKAANRDANSADTISDVWVEEQDYDFNRKY